MVSQHEEQEYGREACTFFAWARTRPGGWRRVLAYRAMMEVVGRWQEGDVEAVDCQPMHDAAVWLAREAREHGHDDVACTLDGIATIAQSFLDSSWYKGAVLEGGELWR